MQFVSTNPLVSAIVAGIVVGLILWMARRAFKPLNEHPMPKGGRSFSAGNVDRSQVAQGDNITMNQHFHNYETMPKSRPDYRNSPTPAEIRADISAKKPFEKASAGEAYTNIPVEWTLRLSTLSRKESGYYSLMLLAFDRYGMPFHVVCENVDLERFPLFKRANEKDVIIVRGKIGECTESLIWLKDFEFDFPQSNPPN